MQGKRMLAALAAAGTVLAGGCTAQPGPAPAGPAASQQAAARPPGVNLVAGQNGLSVTDTSVHTLYTHDEALAIDARGKTYDVATFTSNASRDKWVQVAESMGSTLYAKGNLWAVLDNH